MYRRNFWRHYTSPNWTKKKQDCFLNPDRFYNRLVRKIIAEGQKKHEIREDISVEELAHHVLLWKEASLWIGACRTVPFP